MGLGDPVLDVVVQVSHEFLASIGAQPGGCTLVEPAEMAALTAAATAAHGEAARLPGGSAANVLKGLANVAGGALRCQLVGMVGADEAGAYYTQQLRSHGVDATALQTSARSAPTARCLCLVTPDGQRTMRTCLGAAADLTSVSQIGAGWSPPALLHCEGYILHKPQFARDAMAAAKAAGSLVSLDLASFEVVRACRGALLGLLREGLVDVVFANEEEAAALAERPDAPVVGGDDDESARAARVEAAQALVLRHARCCVVSLGSRGAVARGADGERGRAAASQVSVVDTIGAGDLFSAGFLWAYLAGAALSTACAAGCAAGAEAVQTRGAALSDAAWARLRATVAGLLAAPPSGGAACAGRGAAARYGGYRRAPSSGAMASMASSGPGSSLGSVASAAWLPDLAEAARD